MAYENLHPFCFWDLSPSRKSGPFRVTGLGLGGEALGQPVGHRML